MRTVSAAAALLTAVCVVVLAHSAFAVVDQQWNYSLAQRLLYMSCSCFCKSTTLSEWSCPYCVANFSNWQPVAVLYNSTTRCLGFVAVSSEEQQIVVAFRGTDNNANWILDFSAWLSDDVPVVFDPAPVNRSILVHHGFLRGYLSLREQMFDAIVQAQLKCPQCTHAFVTGHSLGAAISGLAAVELASVYGRASIPLNVSLINFGMPRIGNEPFADWFAETLQGVSWRVVHNEDIVPQVPPRLFGSDSLYHHIGTEQWELPDAWTDVRTCDGSGEDPTCSDSLPFVDWKWEQHMYYLQTFVTCAVRPQPPVNSTA